MRPGRSSHSSSNTASGTGTSGGSSNSSSSRRQSQFHKYKRGNPSSNTSWSAILWNLASVDTVIGAMIGLAIFGVIKSWSHTSTTGSSNTTGSMVERSRVVSSSLTTTTTSVEGGLRIPMDLTAAIASTNDQNNQKLKSAPSPASEAVVATVAYCISVTGCGPDPITEGGAVLKHSIHRASSRGGTLGGRYDYALFAIVHPQAMACATPLQKLGYTLLVRETPVAVSEIRGDYLRSKIEVNGCCGEKELIKLEAYTLTDYPIVVHLDLDVLVLKPMDTLFDMMMSSSSPSSPGVVDSKARDDAVMWQDEQHHQPIPFGADLNALYTVDYNMVNPSVQYKPVQGGFLVLRPDMTVYEEFREIIRIGDFRDHHGWGGLVGPFHGSMTFQGIVPYYYNVLHPGQAIELNRCVYNQMADNPRTEKTVNDVVHGQCRTGQEDCPDCRAASIDTVVTTHFTLCQKPWSCLPHGQDQIQHRLCRQLTREWYKVRSELEQSWGRTGIGSGSYETNVFFGYCTKQGGSGYIPIQEPYEQALV